MDRSNIEKIAQTEEDKILLARLWDKISAGIRKNIPVSTCFLAPREQEMTRYLFGNLPGLYAFGGYEDATRKLLVYLPEYLTEDSLFEEADICCLRATFYEADALSHRDFLGALMGAGIGRETVGDICVATGSCDFFVTRQIAPYLLQNLESVGRTKIKLKEVPLKEAYIPQPEVQEIRDTLASLRLDSVISAGFRISRSSAADYICAGKAVLNGLPCEKPDKAVEEGAVLSVRTLGKIRLKTVGGQTKKGRISVIIERYL
jgi:RNA-binding protein YlmH